MQSRFEPLEHHRRLRNGGNAADVEDVVTVDGGGRNPLVEEAVEAVMQMGGAKCAMVKSRYIGDGHPTFNRNPYNGYINPYYWVDDHPLLYGSNGSLDPGTNGDGEHYSY